MEEGSRSAGYAQVQINMQEREITVKVVYYGPALSGKTTNLQQLHQLINAPARGKMVTLDTSDDRTLYFDFLPIHFGTQNGFSVKIKLFTVPGQVMHKSTRKVVLAGADAVAFIADSQRSASSANAYSYRDLETNLRANGLDINNTPQVVQFNKRDLPDIKPLEEVRAAWESTGIPTIPASAVRGEGVIETFESLLELTFRQLDRRHSFGSKFGLQEAEFMDGLLCHFRGA